MMSRLVHDNTDAFHRMSLLYYHMGEAEDSLRYIDHIISDRCRLMYAVGKYESV